MRQIATYILVIGLASLVISGPVSAVDDWSNECSTDLQPVPSIGTYTGQQDSGGDVDIVPFVLNQDETLKISLTQVTKTQLEVFHPTTTSGDFRLLNIEGADLSQTDTQYQLTPSDSDAVSWYLNAEEAGLFCMGFSYQGDPTDSGVDWKIDVTHDEIDTQTTATPTAERQTKEPTEQAQKTTSTPTSVSETNVTGFGIIVALLSLGTATLSYLRL